MGYAIQGPGLQNLSGTATISFPIATAQEEDTAVTTVLNTVITMANVKGATFIPGSSADHSDPDDFAWDKVKFNIENIVDGVSFDIRATADLSTWGDYTVTYIINYT